jgi:hypothetical protein
MFVLLFLFFFFVSVPAYPQAINLILRFGILSFELSLLFTRFPMVQRGFTRSQTFIHYIKVPELFSSLSFMLLYLPSPAGHSTPTAKSETYWTSRLNICKEAIPLGLIDTIQVICQGFLDSFQQVALIYLWLCVVFFPNGDEKLSDLFCPIHHIEKGEKILPLTFFCRAVFFSSDSSRNGLQK